MSSGRSHTGWWLAGGGVVVVVAAVCSVLVGIAGWLPQAREHEDERSEQPQAGLLAPNAVPQEYRALIEEWGAYCPTLTPPRLAAQLQQESGWRPEVIFGEEDSAAGAKGIGQFLPGTWVTYGIDANGDGRADVYDPEDAIPSAAIYDCAVAREVRHVPGDPVDNMLAAYNAGPGRVIEFSGVPPETWSGGETYSYVRNIRALEAAFTTAFDGSEPAPSGGAARIVHFARQEIGTAYSWGGGGTGGPTRGTQHGASTVGYDCSGLIQYAVHRATDGRITLPRTSSEQRTAGRAVSRDAMRPGDIIVINHDGAWGHVGIYAGRGMMIHAPRTGKTVEEAALAGYWSDFEWDIRRVV